MWVEHARWFPKCAFIRQKLGQQFIDTVALLAQTQDRVRSSSEITVQCFNFKYSIDRNLDRQTVRY